MIDSWLPRATLQKHAVSYRKMRLPAENAFSYRQMHFLAEICTFLQKNAAFGGHFSAKKIAAFEGGTWQKGVFAGNRQELILLGLPQNQER